jgi:hypothetical protein
MAKSKLMHGIHLMSPGHDDWQVQADFNLRAVKVWWYYCTSYGQIYMSQYYCDAMPEGAYWAISQHMWQPNCGVYNEGEKKGKVVPCVN